MAAMPEQEPDQPPGSVSAKPEVIPGLAPAGRRLRRRYAALRVVLAAGATLVVAWTGARVTGWDGAGALPGALRALVGAGLAVILALTVLRAAGRDGPAPLPAVVVWIPYAAPALVVLLLLALALRLPLAAAVAVALLAVQLAWLAPRFSAEPAVTSGSGPRLRVMVANVLAGGATAGAVAAAVREERPDVLALVELTPKLAAALGDTDLPDHLPFQVLDSYPNPGGVGLYARRPLDGGGRLGATHLPGLRATVELDGGHRVGVFTVHAFPPRPGTTELWRDDLETVRAAAAGHPGPLVVVGDFNATADHAGFRALRDAGLRDAHDVRGRGLVRTWPARGPLPPLLHLDHVLVSADLAVLAVRERPIRGSDHLAVVADLALR
jgi:endonuclease/exonuclease/phosphatase (EEP) superfamily protein YafD